MIWFATTVPADLPFDKGKFRNFSGRRDMARDVVEIWIDAVPVCLFLTLIIESMIAGAEREVRLKVFKRLKHICKSKH